jgi:hypothetical protein
MKPEQRRSRSDRPTAVELCHVARRVRLTFPGCHCEFTTSPGKHGGIAFRVKDGRGRYRSNIVRIYRDAGSLTKAQLVRLVRLAGGRADFPHLAV